jgi:hypothetical protein
MRTSQHYYDPDYGPFTGHPHDPRSDYEDIDLDFEAGQRRDRSGRLCSSSTGSPTRRPPTRHLSTCWPCRPNCGRPLLTN